MAEGFVPALKNAVLGLMLIMECNKFLIDSDLKAQLTGRKRDTPLEGNVTYLNLDEVFGNKLFTESCNQLRKQQLAITYFEPNRDDSQRIPEALVKLLGDGFRLLVIRVIPHKRCDQIGDTLGDRVEGNRVITMFVCQISLQPSESTGEQVGRIRYGLLLSPKSALIEFADTIEEEKNFACESETTKPKSGLCLDKIWAIAEDLKTKLDQLPTFAWHSFCYLGCNEQFRARQNQRALALKLTLAWFVLLIAGVLFVLTFPRDFTSRPQSAEKPESSPRKRQEHAEDTNLRHANRSTGVVV